MNTAYFNELGKDFCNESKISHDRGSNLNKTHIYVIKKAASARFELATPGLGNLCSIP